MNLDAFYSRVEVFNKDSHPFGQKLRLLLDEVIQRMPNEKQFQMKGAIKFGTREEVLEFWRIVGPKIGINPKLKLQYIDGNCSYLFGKTVDDSKFIITIIVDNLMQHSDDYIKGLIIHEFSELSYAWKIYENNLESLNRLKPKARQVRINQITKQDKSTTSKEYAEHEVAVNQEGIRLGFEKEIKTLDPDL